MSLPAQRLSPTAGRVGASRAAGPRGGIGARGRWSIAEEPSGTPQACTTLFHVGHLEILGEAKSRCDHLIAAVVSDEMAELAKGRSRVVPHSERLEIGRQDGDVRELRFDVIFKGDDWRGTPKADRLEREFAEVGVGVVYFPYTVCTSSTLLRLVLGGSSACPEGRRRPTQHCATAPATTAGHAHRRCH